MPVFRGTVDGLVTLIAEKPAHRAKMIYREALIRRQMRLIKDSNKRARDISA
jgi:hypothetical protein